MKGRIISAFFHIVMGLGIAIGPYTVFQVCDTSEKIMKCWWSVRAVTALGILLIVAGIFSLLFKEKAALAAISLYNIATSVMVILIPSVLIGGCMKETMPCRSLTFPAIYVMAGIVILFNILFNIGNLFYLKKAGK